MNGGGASGEARRDSPVSAQAASPRDDEEPQLARLSRDIAQGAAALHLPLEHAQCTTLAAYIALLAKWNRAYNLTAIREPARMVTHHVLDSLAVLAHLPVHKGLRVLDVGSGGGLPGIPLAIARPDWHVALVDPVHKKAAFLAQAAIELALRNVTAYAKRVEDLPHEETYDVVISRAFADLATFVTLAGAHVADSGTLVAMKGVHPVDEIAHLPPQFAVIATPKIDVPGLDAARHLVIMRRAS
jgi:16S rRNA (guanine527-N7)-methyltransferase